MGDLERLRARFEVMEKHVKVSKMYLETHRDKILVDGETLEKAKGFFEARGIRTAGGITLTIDERNRFETFCYSDPEHRSWVQQVVEHTARHFDEIILDDFFFTSCKSEVEIRARGERSWTEYRLALLDEAARNLVLAPARKVNPRVKVVIKYPNWYDHFHGLGFNLETRAADLRRDLHGHRDARRGAQRPAPAAVPRVPDLALPGEPPPGPQRGGMGRHRGNAHPRPLRGAAVGHPLRQGARDHALRLPPDADPRPEGSPRPLAGAGDEPRLRRGGRALPEGRRLLRARADGVPRGGVVVPEDRPDPGPAREAGRREELQALPLDGRGLPAQLHGHGRDSHRPAPGVPDRGPAGPPHRGGRARPWHRREDRGAAQGRQERPDHLGAAPGPPGEGHRAHRRARGARRSARSSTSSARASATRSRGARRS